MAVTQYIGARYVPLFFTNPDDNSNNWKSGVAYDPLTIVTDLTQSYTSKIPVPASVGRPSENSEYWILTGAYNAQIEQYRQDVEEVKTDVEEIKTDVAKTIPESEECYIIVSDSYGGTFGNGAGDNTTIFNTLATLFNMPNRIYFAEYDSCGFTVDVGGGTFLQKLTADAANIAAAIDVTKVTKIIVIAGRNDYVSTEANVYSAMAAFHSYVRTTYPTANVYYGFIAGGDNTTHGSKADLILNSYNAFKRCNAFGGIYLNGVENAIHILNGLSADGTHPSSIGKLSIARAVYQAVKTGAASCNFPIAPIAIAPVSGVSMVTEYPISINSVVVDNMLYLFQAATIAGFTCNAQAVPANALVTINIGTISGYINHPFGSIILPVTARINGNMIPAYLVMNANSEIYLRYYSRTAETVNAVTISSVGNMTPWPLVYC